MSSNKPSHRVYAVSKGKKKQSFWREIGAAWAHEDGQGMNIVLDSLPLNGADIVIRVPLPEKAEAAQAGMPEAGEAA